MIVDLDFDVTVDVDASFDVDPEDGFAVASWEPVRPRTELWCGSCRAIGLSWVEVKAGTARAHTAGEDGAP